MDSRHVPETLSTQVITHMFLRDITPHLNTKLELFRVIKVKRWLQSEGHVIYYDEPFECIQYIHRNGTHYV